MTLARTDWRRFAGHDYVGWIQDDILSVESTQCIHSHLSTAERYAGFAVEMTAKCTKLKVLELSPDYNDNLSFSTRSFLNVLNKSTSLQTLSLKKVQLSDMVSPPRDVYNVASPNCISLYYMYRMWRLLLGISVELSSNSITSQM